MIKLNKKILLHTYNILNNEIRMPNVSGFKTIFLDFFQV